MFANKLRAELSSNSLLEHRFYQLWEEGKLSKAALADYTKQYHCFISTLPRFISLVYSKCDNPISRRILLENLIIEGRGRDNKAKFWCNFANKLDVIEYDVEYAVPNKTTEFILNKYWNLCNTSSASGLGALYAYDYYAPIVTSMQMKSLKENYNIKDKISLEFFKSYQNTNVWDSDKIIALIVKLINEDQVTVFNSAISAHKAMWTFLDGILIVNNLDNY